MLAAPLPSSFGSQPLTQCPRLGLQLITNLSMWSRTDKSFNYDSAKEEVRPGDCVTPCPHRLLTAPHPPFHRPQTAKTTKDVKSNIFESVPRIFSTSLPLRTRIEAFFMDYSASSLFVQVCAWLAACSPRPPPHPLPTPTQTPFPSPQELYPRARFAPRQASGVPPMVDQLDHIAAAADSICDGDVV